MTRELPPRWIDDPAAPGELRASCRALATEGDDYDVAAGLARLRAGIVRSSAATPARTAARGVGASSKLALLLTATLVGQQLPDAAPASMATCSLSRFAGLPRQLPLREHADVASAPAAVGALPPDPLHAASERARPSASRARARRPEPEHATQLAPAPPVVDPPLARRGADEVRAMLDIRRALVEDPARALELLAVADREFADGYFDEERRVSEVLALDRSSQRARARALGRALLARHPESVHARKLRAVLECRADEADGNCEPRH